MKPGLGIFDENGEGEVVGGIVVMRYGENADEVITAVKKKMEEVAKGFPQGVKFNIMYDRSELDTGIDLLNQDNAHRRNDRRIVGGYHFSFSLEKCSQASSYRYRSRSRQALFCLNAFGITSNIMSLTGIALAIGVIVDNGIIMAENSYKNLSHAF